MNEEQKQRAAQMLRRFSHADPRTLSADNAAVDMAALLQELVDEPEPEPVARVTGYYGGYLSIATVDGRVLPAGTALYAAPPHQSEQHLEMVRDAERYRWLKARVKKDTSYDRFGPDGCHWSIGFYGKSAQSLDAAIDAAIAAEKGGA